MCWKGARCCAATAGSLLVHEEFVGTCRNFIELRRIFATLCRIFVQLCRIFVELCRIFVALPTCDDQVGTKYLGPGTWYQVLLPSTWVVPSNRYQILGVKYLIPSLYQQALESSYFAHSTWYLGQGTRHFILRIWTQLPAATFCPTCRRWI